MIVTNNSYNEMFNSVAREFVGRVELLEGSTLLNTFTYDGALQSFTVEKTGDNTRFFGYGICHKATVKLRDKERAITVTKGQQLLIAHGIGADYLYTYPVLYIDQVTRDENTNDLTITAYDALYTASGHKVSEVLLPETFTLEAFLQSAGHILDTPVSFENISPSLLSVGYSKSTMNVDGTESLRECLDDAAEVLGAIYYINNDWELTFKRLDIGGDPVLAIDKSKYFTLTAKPAVTLTKIASVTEFGDNVYVGSDTGETQYLRENVFLTLLDDASPFLGTIWNLVNGLTIIPFDCRHRGDFRLEIGDKISLTTKDDKVIETYFLGDSITYNGGLVSITGWEYSASENETDSAPVTLGEAIRQTYAKVDKANQEISLVASQVEENTEEISQVKLETESISLEVAQNASTVTGLQGEVNTLSQQVSQTITSEDVVIAVEQKLLDGVNVVSTKTGFTFDNQGLTISKSDNEMSTQITEDGMTIYRDETGVLVADHEGVQATNLHATTYLIIGKNSRFEDYDNKTRTGCFWIGG